MFSEKAQRPLSNDYYYFDVYVPAGWEEARYDVKLIRIDKRSIAFSIVKISQGVFYTFEKLSMRQESDRRGVRLD